MLEDFEDMLAAQEHAKRRFCGYTRWVRGLDEKDQAKADSLLSNDDYTSASLTSYFRSKGASLDAQVVNRHRKGICCGQRPS